MMLWSVGTQTKRVERPQMEKSNLVIAIWFLCRKVESWEVGRVELRDAAGTCG